MAQPKDIQKVAKGFRASNQGLKLGRALFDPNVQFKLSPTQITNLLRDIGVDIPSEVGTTLAAGQMIMSGGAFVNSFSAGKDILQITQLGLATTNQAMGVLQALGLVDYNTVFGRTISLASNAAAVISSGGLNILADIAFIADLISNILFPIDERPQVRQMLKQMNYQAANQWWQDRQKPQSEARLKLIDDYQKNKISMFEFIGEFALQSPDSFLNYFPEYGIFLPPVAMKKCWTARQTAAYGGFLFIGRSEEEIIEEFCLDYKTIFATKNILNNVFFQKYIGDPMSPYIFLSAMTKSYVDNYGFHPNGKIKKHPDAIYPRIGADLLALLSVITKQFDYIPDDFDIAPILRNIRMTPYQLGYKTLFRQSMTETDFYLSNDVLPTAAITFNGVDLRIDRSSAAKKAKIIRDRYTAEKIEAADQAGDIEALLKIPEAKAIIQEWGVLPYLDPNIEKLLPVYRVTDKNSVVNYRNIQNYFSSYSVLNFMLKDSWLADYNFKDLVSYHQNFIKSAEAMQNWYRELNFSITAKYLNVMARENVASFFKTTQENVEFKNNKDGTAFIVPKGR